MAVQFEEEAVPLAMKMPEPQTGSVTKFFISLGLAKTARDAQVIMVIVAAILLGVAAYIFIIFTLTPTTKPLTQEELQQVLQEGAIRH
jgi:hypothetical protein